MNNVVVIGSINIDMVSRMPVFPKVGETVFGDEFSMFPGGKGANQALAMAKLGMNVTMIGKIGNDVLGQKALTLLVKNNVNVSNVEIEDSTFTGIASIQVNEEGSNTIVVIPGANSKVTPDLVRKHKEQIIKADAIILQLEIPLESVMEAIDIAYESGVLVILNPAPACALPDSVYQKVSIIIINDNETQALSGYSTESQDSLTQAGQFFIKRGCNSVVFTLGESGAKYISSEYMKLVHVPPYFIEPVDTVAAGDAFVGGFTFAYLRDVSLERAVQWGNACGALACTKPGAQTSLPSLDEVLNFIKLERA
jgi:ribokinase